MDALPPRDIRDDRDIVHREIPRDRDIRVVRDPLVRDREPGRYPERDERRPLSPDAPYRDAYRAPRDRAYPPNDFYESHDRRGNPHFILENDLMFRTSTRLQRSRSI